MQAGTKERFVFNYNLGILLWILSVRVLRLMLHKSVTPKLLFMVLSLPDAPFAPLQLPVPFSFTSTLFAFSLFVFVIEFTSSTSQSFDLVSAWKRKHGL